MKIYTSNYARNAGHPGAIAISKKPPTWYKGSNYPHIAPTWDLIYRIKGGQITEEEYTSLYLDMLKERAFNPQHFVDSLEDEVTVLLCYEKPTDFCHRHIVASLIEERTGVKVPEWLNEKELATQRQHELVDNLLDF